ncbi:MAG: hypothetical protein GEU92_12400 [Alphaproteobacteria bacterium]|nr:hypothetical protein [Alphaproteobacteria bacterium]
MLGFNDCLALSALTEAEIDAIARHENLTEMVALELGNYLIRQPDGCVIIKGMILDDIAEAESRGRAGRAVVLKATLKHFIDTHPDNPANA